MKMYFKYFLVLFCLFFILSAPSCSSCGCSKKGSPVVKSPDINTPGINITSTAAVTGNIGDTGGDSHFNLADSSSQSVSFLPSPSLPFHLPSAGGKMSVDVGDRLKIHFKNSFSTTIAWNRL